MFWPGYMNINRLARYLPPASLSLYRKLFRRGIVFLGDYPTWDAAVRQSRGYDDDAIIEKVLASALRIKAGDGLYEQDSVVFYEENPSWPLLAGLMWIAAQNSGRLNVLDFGGSFGSVYHKHRRFLSELREVRWNIVEQTKIVELGKQHFETETIRFYYDINSCLAETKPDIILFSSVLQYIEKPYDLLQKALDSGIEQIIVDRTPFHKENTDRITVQHVSPKIVDTSYPAWIFSIGKFESFFNSCEIPGRFESDGNEPFEAIKILGYIIRNRQADRRGHGANGNV